MSWFVIIFFLSLAFNSLSEAGHEKNLPSAVVVGSVYCDTCFQEDFSKSSHFISGSFRQLHNYYYLCSSCYKLWVLFLLCVNINVTKIVCRCICGCRMQVCDFKTKFS